MKLLDLYIDPADAATARGRLRQAGIASAVAPMDPHSVQPSKSGATRIGLWVLVDAQFEDALRVLEDPAYRPQRVLSAAEIDRLETAEVQRARKQRNSDKLLLWVLFSLLLALISLAAAEFFIGP